MKRLILISALLAMGGAAQAQQPTVTVIAIPPLTSPNTGAKGNEMLALGWEATQLIGTDLRQTSEIMPLTSKRDDY